ncbi:ATP-dependent zinc metalloprotease FtsH [Paramaledivibacter caminithermalis]|uniref:ATP-dependent zinc metalloprotease FtsH n=1 Tax=Paramaledivibacter caminithermalis (strain DSM 15212 / CIP 107654 / DViRD3) TaxID=1121301 RepID=A0A1M6PYN7_PARC5|nr:ATP-dependent zinc metalloprotease FtsH [Paramaledivibacter caminithermalis]SHK13050.1 cell division protease FtsH [Paramaledivibacter caminithermalis DSM 15212]
MKRKTLFIILLSSIILNIVLIIASRANGKSPASLNIRSSTLSILILFSIICLIYYLKSHNSPQFAPVNLKSEKNEKRNDKSDEATIGFKDVAGLDEAKEELGEIIDFLKNPDKYRAMGAKIPKGILLHGPPGTGKTLLARAIAGETNSKFIPASGSEFVEKYVGVGAKRVRALFEKARKEAPSVIFIDEIDAIGAKRTLESNNEKDQTLNQLLIEMDGFNNDQTVIIIGATNRIDMLDEALKRPGRFDRNIFIGNPDIKSREEIFKVHIRNKPISPKIDVKDLAKRTHGMSGAHISNIANEAAILAVRNNKKIIDIDDFNNAIEKVIGGLERKNFSIIEKEKRRVSFHEAGHALMGKILNTDLISKISIIPRSQALGYVMYTPDEERFLITKDELYNKIKVMLGGRAAEEIVLGNVSTGAKDDLKKANQIAFQMVCEYGMSDLQNRFYEPSLIRNCYDTIDKEINKIILHCYKDTLTIIESNKDLLGKIAEILFEKETLTGEELNKIIKAFDSSKNLSII